MDEKCLIDPSRDCLGLKKANEVASDLKSLDRRVSDFQQAVSETNARFGARIGGLETKQEVREEQFRQFKERLDDITKEIVEFQRENKGSLAEFRKENKESIAELSKSIKEVIDTLSPMKHDVEDLKGLKVEVDEIQEKPAKRWESATGQIVSLVIAAVVGFIISRFGV